MTSGATPTDLDDFDPAVHGFGFGNWERETGIGAHGQEFTYESGDVTEDDVRRAIEHSWRTPLSDALRELLTRIVHSWIGSLAATNGHCYGMVWSADVYFRNPSELPDGIEAASEVPRPTGRYVTVGDRIRVFQTSQILRAEAYWWGLLGLRWGMGDHVESIKRLTEAIDATGTGGLALDGAENTHLVLAYAYDLVDGVTDVSLYDPNYRAADHADSDEMWTLSVDRETGDILEIDDKYEEFIYHEPGIELLAVDGLIGGRDGVIDHLSNAVFLGLETPGVLETHLAGEVTVDRPAAEYSDPDGGPYADAILVLGELDEFELSIDGETSEKYSLAALALRDGEIVLDEIVSDTFDEVPVRLRLAIDDAGDFVIDTVENVEEAAEGNQDGGSWIENNWWIPAAGGALGIGIGYWLLANRSDGEDTHGQRP